MLIALPHTPETVGAAVMALEGTAVSMAAPPMSSCLHTMAYELEKALRLTLVGRLSAKSCSLSLTAPWQARPGAVVVVVVVTEWPWLLSAESGHLLQVTAHGHSMPASHSADWPVNVSLATEALESCNVS